VSAPPSAAAELQVAEGADGVLAVTINRPDKHNPLSSSVLAALRDALRTHGASPALRVVVIRGAGSRYFAAGGDLRALAGVRTAAQTRDMVAHSRDALDAVRDLPVPVVALLNGDALGGGAELALACDLRVIRAGARIGYVQGRLNICSAWGGGPDLFALVGPARALRMTARAEMVDAPTALAWGLVDHVVPDDGVEAGLDAFVEPMLRQPPAVLRAWKSQARALRRGEPYETRRAIERDALIDTWLHADHWAAVDRVLAPPKEAR
jgi:enoyl-CoA hydratase/carnithine racemase